MPLLLVFLALFASPALGRDDGRWAQLNLSPQQKKWFQDQVEPGTSKPCCNSSDGEEVQEDIRDGVYWIMSTKTEGQWLPVPPSAIITEPNKWGQPVAWFFHESGKPKVRCFSPGALL